jgi:hypothetical protein
VGLGPAAKTQTVASGITRSHLSPSAISRRASTRCALRTACIIVAFELGRSSYSSINQMTLSSAATLPTAEPLSLLGIRSTAATQATHHSRARSKISRRWRGRARSQPRCPPSSPTPHVMPMRHSLIVRMPAPPPTMLSRMRYTCVTPIQTTQTHSRAHPVRYEKRPPARISTLKLRQCAPYMLPQHSTKPRVLPIRGSGVRTCTNRPLDSDRKRPIL